MKTQKIDENLVATTAATLAAQTASKAAELASTAASTAASLASDTAKSTAVMSNDMAWVKKSLEGIETSLKTMGGIFVTQSDHAIMVKDVEDQEKRLRKIEENMWKSMGAVSLISTMITLGIGLALKFIHS